MTQWQTKERTTANRTKIKFTLESFKLPLKKRIDIILAIGILLGATLILGGWYITITAGDRNGLWDQFTMRPLPDQRLLTNIRDNIEQDALLDAVWHQHDERIYITQEEGAIHSYHPRTNLWRSESPFPDATNINQDFVLLRSGCGTISLADCPTPDTLWAVTKEGGLIQRLNDRWRIIVSDTTFVGARQQPLSSADLTTAVLSADQKYLLVGTKQDGLGLYDTTQRAWLPLPTTLQDKLPAYEITHLRWWQNKFWIGTPNGLKSGQIQNDTLTVDDATIFEDEIIDLDITLDDQLLILAQQACEEAGERCLRLIKMSSARSKPAVILDSQNHFAELNLANVNFAQQINDLLILASDTGIYSYDTRYHTWQRPFNDAIHKTLTLPTNDGFYYAFNGGAGLMQNGAIIRTWELPQGEITDLLYGPNNQVLAFMQNGDLLALGSNEQADTILNRTRTALTADDFTHTFAYGNTILFVTQNGGALLHNVHTRHYNDLSSTQLPPWLQDPNYTAVTAGTNVYFYALGQTAIYILPLAQLETAAYFSLAGIQAELPTVLPSPVTHAWQWGDEGLGIITETGNSYRLTDQSIETIIGDSLEQANLRFADVTMQNDTFIGLSNGDLYQYDTLKRAWATWPTPFTREIADVATWNDNTLLLQTTNNELLSQTNNASTLLIGDVNGFQIPDNRLTDALYENGQLYLSGNGRIEQYDTTLRRVTQFWELGTSSSIQLHGIVNNQPLALAGRIASLGETRLSEDAITLSVDNQFIWITQADGTNRYLQRHHRDNINQISCYFRNPRINATQINDARSIGNKIVAATNAGLYLYLPAHRSWFPVTTTVIPSRLYYLNNHILLVTASQIEFIAIDELTITDTCTNTPLTVNSQRYPITAVAVDEPSNRVAWLDRDGQLSTWENGAQRTLLLPPNSGPTQATLKRVFQHNDTLYFTTSNNIWRYQIETHQWTAINFNQNLPPIIDINLEPLQGATFTVIVKTNDGNVYQSLLTNTTTELIIDTPIFRPQTPFNNSGATLIDAQGGTVSYWYFLLNDRVKYFNPQTRTWAPDGILPEAAVTPVALQYSGNHQVVVGENNSIWWVFEAGTTSTNAARYEVTASDQATAIDNDGDIWRLRPNGRILHCRPLSEQYQCDEHMPPAMPLDEDVVKTAFTWQALIVFITDDSVRIFDTNSRTEITPSTTIGFNAQTNVRQFEGQRWLYDGHSRLLILDNSTDTLATIINGVEHLRFDTNKQPWAYRDNSWQIWDGSTFTIPTPTTLKYFVTENGIVTGIDNDGVPHTQLSETMTPDDHPLPIDPAIITNLFKGSNEDWWVLTDSQIHHVTNSCDTSTTITNTKCLQITGTVQTNLPIVPVNVQVNDTTLTLIDESNTSWRIMKESTGVYNITQRQNVMPTYQNLISDGWATLRNNVQPLPTGQSAYDPFLDIATNSAGRLVASKPTGNLNLATGGNTQLRQRPPLHVSWLRWHREQQQFIVATPTASLSFTPEEFINNGRFLFEPVEALLPNGSERWWAANQYGVWHYGNATLALNDASITFTPVPLDTPITAAHNHFITPNQLFSLSGQTIVNTPTTHSVDYEDVTFIEQLRQPQISGQLLIGDQETSPFALNGGFIWDEERRGLAYAGDDLLLQSNAGIHPHNQLSAFDSGPNNVARQSGRLIHESGQLPLLFNDNSWYQRAALADWSTLPQDPTTTRPLFTTPLWTWQVRNNLVEIDWHDDLADFTQADNVNTFRSDQLLAATTYQGQLYIVTAAFLEVANHIDDLTQFTTSKQATFPISQFRTVRDGSRSTLYRIDNDNSYWQLNGATFTTTTNPAESNRTLVETEQLRFSTLNNTVTKEVWGSQPQENEGWQKFRLTNDGFFPFDKITAVSVHNNILYLGSVAGLQQYHGIDTALNNLQQLHYLPIEQVGLASDNMTIIARSTDGCIQSQQQQFTPCTSDNQNSALIRIKTPFWQWFTDENKSVFGYYQTSDSGQGTRPIQIENGRFPHDQPTDITTCPTNTFILWQWGEHWLTQYPHTDIHLQASDSNQTIREVTPTQLICLKHDQITATGTVSAGTYLRTLTEETAAFWHHENNRWQPYTNELAPILQGYLDNTPPFEQERLRLQAPSDNYQTYTFEQRTLAGEWLPLTWQADRLSIDQWQQIIYHGNFLWAATADGFIPFTLNNELTLNPRQINIIREPLSPAQCTITDIQTVADAIFVRCHADSQQVFEGTLTLSQDSELFTLTELDPFVEQQLISHADTGYWEWQIRERRGGSRGIVTAALHNEEVQLTGGTFNFDTIYNMAAFTDERIELATTASGWYRLPVNNLHLRHFMRLEGSTLDYSDINAVNITHDQDGTALCLRKTGGTYLRMREDNTFTETSTCPAFLGQDSLWQYFQEPDGHLSIIAPQSIGELGYRTLEAGRFTDDRVVNLPTIGQNENGLFYLIPTQAGILQLNEVLANNTIYTPDVSQFATTPLLMADSQTAVYIYNNAIHPVDNRQSTPLTWPILLPPIGDTAVINHMPQGHLRYRWSTLDKTQQWLDIQPETEETLNNSNQLQIDLSQLTRFIQRSPSWQNPSPILVVDSSDNNKQMLFHFDNNQPLTLTTDSDFQFITSIEIDNKIIIIGRHELYEINLDRVIMKAQQLPNKNSNLSPSDS